MAQRPQHSSTEEPFPGSDDPTASGALLERQRQWGGSILDSVPDAILSVAADGTVRGMNSAAQKLFGVTADEITRPHVSALLPGMESALPMQDLLESSRRSGGFEWEARGAGGRRVPVHVAIGELVDAGEMGFILVMRNFRGVRAAQRQALRRERLAAMGETMTALAHESRNALQRIQSCLTLLELRGDPDVLPLLDDMQDAQDHLQGLYEEVRSFAAPLSLEIRRCDLAELLTSAWLELETQWQPKGLICVSPQTLPSREIAVDCERFARVLRNVLENAVHASPQNGTIEIGVTEALLEEQRAVEISIRDEGPGISSEVRQRAFDLLFTTKKGGTGMGLAISRRIVQEHGGEITLSSSRERGTTVFVRVPQQIESMA